MSPLYLKSGSRHMPAAAAVKCQPRPSLSIHPTEACLDFFSCFGCKTPWPKLFPDKKFKAGLIDAFHNGPCQIGT